jgi:hypothetical protein
VSSPRTFIAFMKRVCASRTRPPDYNSGPPLGATSDTPSPRIRSFALTFAPLCTGHNFTLIFTASHAIQKLRLPPARGPQPPARTYFRGANPKAVRGSQGGGTLIILTVTIVRPEILRDPRGQSSWPLHLLWLSGQRHLNLRPLPLDLLVPRSGGY